MNKTYHLWCKFCLVLALLVPIGVQAHNVTDPVTKDHPSRLFKPYTARQSAFQRLTRHRAVRPVLPLPLTAAKAPAADDAPTLYALVPNKGYDDDYRIVSFKAAPGIKFEEVFSDPYLESNVSAVYADGKFYSHYLTQDGVGLTLTNQYVFDANSWDLLDKRAITYDQPCANCMTYDPLTGNVYLQQPYEEGASRSWAFGKMDVATGETSLIALQDGSSMVCLAAAPDGKIYGINTNGMLQEINKTTGAITKIGNTDIKPATYLQSATIDPSTGRMYWAAFTDTGTSALYEVDLATGHVTLISLMPEKTDLIALYIPDPVPGDDCPASVDNIDFNFDGPSLSGQIGFNVPSTTMGGDQLKGDLTAKLRVDGNIYEKKVQPGQRCNFDVTIKKTGYVIASATIVSEKGKSKQVDRQQWIGPDYPEAPANLTLTRDSGNVARLTWNAPRKGTHGGYVNPKEVLYRIYGSSGTGVWVDAYPDTVFTTQLTNHSLRDVTFNVRPSYKGLFGEPATSNEVSFVDFNEPPCSFGFSNATTFGQCNVIDANSDGVTWERTAFGYCKMGSPRTGANDDWIITPKVKLSASKRYVLTYKARTRGYSTETMDLYMGQGTTVDSMTTLLKRDTLKLSTKSNRVLHVTVPADGDYNFGFHATSSSGWELRLYYLDIDAEADMTAPDSVQNLTVTPAARGELKAVVAFDAPVKDISGNAIAGLSKIEVLRGKDVVGTIDAPQAGQKCTFTDNGPRLGNNTYTVVAYNNLGSRGAEAVRTAYVGVDVPDFVDNLRLRQQGDNALLTWTAPQRGYKGGFIDPDKVTYTVYNTFSRDPIKQGLTSTQFTEPLTIPARGQYALNYMVDARNEAGTNGGATVSNAIIVGNPYTLPVKEDFNYGLNSYSWFPVSSGDLLDDDGWTVGDGNGYGNESGYTRYYAYGPGEDQDLISGKISLKGAKKPMLHFQLFGSGKKDELNIYVADDFNGEFKLLKKIVMNEMTPKQWTPYDIPLDDYVNKDYIHISFGAHPVESDCSIVLDQIWVRDVKDTDAAVIKFDVDNDAIEVGKSVSTATATVVNHGAKEIAAGSYTVDFKADGKVFATVTGTEALKPWATAALNAQFVPTLRDAKQVKLTAQVNCGGDGDTGNNESDSVPVFITKPLCPVVENLQGYRQGNDVNLNWSVPDLSGTPVRTIVDDFESYRPWQINHAGDWTMNDQDRSTTTHPGWLYTIIDGKPMAWTVYNTTHRLSPTKTIADVKPAYSGVQYMVSMASAEGDNDDWLITPELSGNAQSISFMAQSGSEEFGHEMLRYYYSKTDTALASFTPVDSVIHYIPSKWTEITVNVPDGAKYFAVRCVSHKRSMTMLDDFTYEECAHPLTVKFLGYNVYRDGQLLNEKPLSTTTYVDAMTQGGEYYVVAVYDVGESDASNRVAIHVQSGIAGVEADKAAGNHGTYDILGRKVNRMEHNQLYIENGKKILK